MSFEVAVPAPAMGCEHLDDNANLPEELTLPPACFDAELVSQLIPNTTEPCDEMADTLNELIDVGSRSLLYNRTTPEESENIRDACARFYTKLGWTDPDHPLFKWYTTELKHNHNGVNPGTVTQNMRFIRDLYGGECLMKNIVRTTQFLSSDTETLLKEYDHITRLASVAGWDAWDVRQLVQAQPLILKRAPKTQFFYARMAADHGDQLGLTKDPESFSRRGPFAHAQAHLLMARFTRMSVGVQRSSIGKHEKPGEFLQILNTEARQKRMGADVMRAYFRAYPVRNGVLLRDKYPNLQQYHRAFMREGNRTTGFSEIVESTRILPDEPWLQAVRLPGKSIDINALNRYAQVGSRRLHNRAPNFKELSAKTHEARAKFIEELGWFDPTHRLYDFACQVRDSPVNIWPNTANMVEIIRLIERHTTDVTRCIQAVGFLPFGFKPETLEKKILAAEQVYDNEVLYRWPNILRKSVSEIVALGQKKRGSSRSRAPILPKLLAEVTEPLAAPDTEAVASPPEVKPPRLPLAHPTQKYGMFAAELSEEPLPNTVHLPIQIVQQLPMADRAAIYVAHCLPWLFTTRMIEEGWNDPTTVMERVGVQNRAELIGHVATNIMSKVRTQVEANRPSSDETALEGVKGLLRWLHQEIEVE